LRASDGTVLGTFTVGVAPLGIAFDGAVWVANRNSNTVDELRASDGTVLGTFTAPGGPYGVAFDLTYVWVSGDSYLLVLRASDGTQVALHAVQSEGLAFDGAYMWTAVQSGSRLRKF
jgi:DNA-binding beta-propeller fold protein YncE